MRSHLDQGRACDVAAGLPQPLAPVGAPADAILRRAEQVDVHIGCGAEALDESGRAPVGLHAFLLEQLPRSWRR